MKPSMWMPLWIGDYLRDTLGLDRAEHGSYLLFIMAYWANGGPIKDDDRLVKNIVRCPDHEWSRTRGWLLDYFTIENGYWRHKRIDAELKAAKDRAEAQRRRTQAATEARLGNVTSDVTSNVTKNVTFTSSPSPSPSSVQPPSQPSSRRKEGEAHPSLQDVKTRASMTGMPEADAVAFWNHFESTGWIDKNGNPIVRWQAKMDNWKASSRATAYQPKTGMAGAILAEKELKRIEARIASISEAAPTTTAGKFYNEAQRKEMKELRERRKELLKQLGFKA